MNKEFIPYEQALELKALGFDEQCFSFYDTDAELYESEGYYKNGYNVSDKEVIAPIYQQAFRWFREKNFICHVTNDLSNNLQDEVYVYIMTKGYGSLIVRSEEYNTYEEAELACLKKLIEIVKNK